RGREAHLPVLAAPLAATLEERPFDREEPPQLGEGALRVGRRRREARAGALEREREHGALAREQERESSARAQARRPRPEHEERRAPGPFGIAPRRRALVARHPERDATRFERLREPLLQLVCEPAEILRAHRRVS